MRDLAQAQTGEGDRYWRPGQQASRGQPFEAGKDAEFSPSTFYFDELEDFALGESGVRLCAI